MPQLLEQGVVDEDRLVNQLTLEDWVKIADTFDAWPFRPAVRPLTVERSMPPESCADCKVAMQTLFDEYTFESDRI